MAPVDRVCATSEPSAAALAAQGWHAAPGSTAPCVWSSSGARASGSQYEAAAYAVHVESVGVLIVAGLIALLPLIFWPGKRGYPFYDVTWVERFGRPTWRVARIVVLAVAVAGWALLVLAVLDGLGL